MAKTFFAWQSIVEQLKSREYLKTAKINTSQFVSGR